MKRKIKIFLILFFVLMPGGFLKADENPYLSLDQAGILGPEIKVGLLVFDRSFSTENSITIFANKDYLIKDKDGNVIATVDADIETKIRYGGDGTLRVYGSIDSVYLETDVNFEAADGDNQDIIFDVEPMTFDDYRGKMLIHYYDSDRQVWAINILPLEQYVWGMGEITATGPEEYNKVMTTLFRTYGYKKKIHGLVNQEKGFDVDITSGNQIYYGYDWENDHPRIREAAEITVGEMVTYETMPIWTAYSSGTDGRTRSWEEVWGSYVAYCLSVSDPWGVINDATTRPGNHMVGLSATGALKQANEGGVYKNIIRYYYTGVKVERLYVSRQVQ